MAKHVNVDKFSGEQEKWDEWSFALKRAIRSQNKRVYDALVAAEASVEDLAEEVDLDPAMEQRSGELYDILCQVCIGEALVLVRSVADLEGVRAWQVLFRKYNPKTMARGLRMMLEVVNPFKIKELAEVETAVAKCEEKARALAAQFEESLSDRMKMAILTSMLPRAAQEYVYAHADKDITYLDLKEKIRAMVANRISSDSGPVPMDVGQIGSDATERDVDEETEDVNGIGWGRQCYNCWGFGHFATQCPTKGKGGIKGGGAYNVKGGGKGAGAYNVKGGGKGGGAYNVKGGGAYNVKGSKGGDPKGQGKGGGYQGKCWRCDKIGHKAAECPKMDTNAVEMEEEPREEVPMGGLWQICQVDYRKTRNRFGRLARDDVDGDYRKTSPVTRNRFEHLARDDVEEVGVWSVESERPKSILFNVANVAKPLAAAGKVVEAGNKIVLDEEGSYVENKKTGERMKLRKDRGVYVLDVTYDNGSSGAITLDSGAGVSVWPVGLLKNVPMEPKKGNFKMVAANGTEIVNLGRKTIRFKEARGRSEPPFQRQSW